MNEPQIVPWPTVDFLPEIINRFWSRVQKTEGCWVWQGATIKKGYGSFNPGSSRKGSNPWISSRFAWFVTFGVIPIGLWVLHKCDNPPCCNPDHLFLGTVKDNAADARQKGRLPVGCNHWTHTHPEHLAKGENHHGAKLTATNALEIRSCFKIGNTSKAELGREFGVDRTTISRIIHRKIWAHV